MTDVAQDDPGVTHLDAAALAARIDHLRAAPSEQGHLVLIVGRPEVGERRVLAEARLSHDDGLVGDNWNQRRDRRTPDGSPNPAKQLTLINARVSRLLAGDATERQALAGDQLHVDLDLSHRNLPAGTRLVIGDAVIEVTAEPHNGCAKFAARFGRDAVRFVNSKEGKPLRLRGLNARVVHPGTIRAGDTVTVERPTP